MNIEYLQELRDNPYRYDDEPRFGIKGAELSEIQHLEGLYNNGNPFPKALKEFIYLAGKYCYLYDGGGANLEAYQEEQRGFLASEVPNIDRPFYVIDSRSRGDAFSFVYLDEGDDPLLWALSFEPAVAISEDTYFYTNGRTLSEDINYTIEIIKRGGSAF